MQVQDFFRYLADVAYFAIFAATLLDAIRHPRRVTVDAALFFGALAGAVASTLVLRLTGVTASGPVAGAQAAVVMALPYLLLRLADDFAGVRPSILRLALVLLVPVVALGFVLPQPYPRSFTLLLVGYFAAFTAHATARFVAKAVEARGVTRRRMQAVAAGSAFLTVAIVLAGARTFAPDQQALWNTLSSLATLGCGLSFFLGFSTPAPLRRLWRERYLRTVVELIATLPASRPFAETLPALNRAVAAAVGADTALTILRREADGRLWIPGTEDVPDQGPQSESSIAMRSFRTQQPMFVEDAPKVDPANAHRYLEYGARGLLVAPVTGQGRQWGVLAALSKRPSVFAQDDLELVESFARAIAAFLTRSELVRADIDMRARAEAVSLKDEFLSAAAHDLRSPLTVLLGQAQLLRRRLRGGKSDPEQDLEAAEAIVAEARRMQRLANGLLDTARMDAGQFVLEVSPTDLTALARRVAGLMSTASHSVEVEGPPVVALVDSERMMQVLENLVETPSNSARRQAPSKCASASTRTPTARPPRTSSSAIMALASRPPRSASSSSASSAGPRSTGASAALASGCTSAGASSRSTAAASGPRASPASTQSSTSAFRWRCPRRPWRRTAAASRRRRAPDPPCSKVGVKPQDHQGADVYTGDGPCASIVVEALWLACSWSTTTTRFAGR